MPMDTVEIKAFVPAKDFELSVSASGPADRPWAIRDFTLHDPSGVLWRIGSNIRSG